MSTKTQKRLLIGTACAVLLVGNALPVLGAATGLLTWMEVRAGFWVLNLLLVLPALPPAMLAAWIQSHDPDLRAMPPWFNSFVIVFLTIAGYAASTALVNNLVAPAFPSSAALFLPRNVGMVLFQTVIVTAIAFVPAWLVESAVVRWALRARTAAH